MKLNALFVITGICALFFGLLAVLIPGSFYAFYGGELSDTGKNASQLQGAAYLGYAMLFFFAIRAKDLIARRAIIIGAITHCLIGAIVSLKVQIAGVTNAWGWSTIVIFSLLTLAYLYFLFKKSTA